MQSRRAMQVWEKKKGAVSGGGGEEQVEQMEEQRRRGAELSWPLLPHSTHSHHPPPSSHPSPPPLSTLQSPPAAHHSPRPPRSPLPSLSFSASSTPPFHRHLNDSLSSPSCITQYRYTQHSAYFESHPCTRPGVTYTRPSSRHTAVLSTCIHCSAPAVSLSLCIPSPS